MVAAKTLGAYHPNAPQGGRPVPPQGAAPVAPTQPGVPAQPVAGNPYAQPGQPQASQHPAG
ncbi:hypothetical protein ACGF07_18325 [Kitasatospora sp. NPDC048194]|uniref:hypothetical protein n=1 Tax=Kitasatospora sp. NPDC048194 TaxID=3364045 RepID=UPI003714CBFD